MRKPLNTSIYIDYIQSRIFKYNSSDIRNSWILFREHINDYVRRGSCISLSAPITLHVALTNVCNLSCNHCYYNFTSNAMNLSLDIIEQISLEASKMGIHEIVLEGGEPLCHPYFLDVIKTIKSYGLSIDVLTNGTLLDSTTATSLAHALDPKLDALQISIDGPKQVHDSIRGTGSYLKSISGAHLISECLKNTRINCVYRGMKYDELCRLCEDILRKTNIRILHFSPLLPIGRTEEKKQPLSEEATEEYICRFLKLRQQYSDKLTITGTFINDADLYALIGKPATNHGACGCCGGRSKLYIDATGYVYPCAFLVKNTYALGNIYTQSLREIWSACNPALRKQLTEQSMTVNSTSEIFRCPALKGVST